MTTAAPTRVLEALRYRRFLISSWPWRALAYVLPTLIISGMIWLVLGCLLSPWIATGVAVQNGRHLGLWPAVLAGVIGLILVAFFGSPIAVGLARVERRRMRLIDSRPIRSGHTGSGFWSLYTDSATWREFAYLVLVGVTVPIWGAVFSIAGVGIGALLVTPLVAASHGSRAGDALASAPNSPSLGQATALAVLGLLLLPIFAYGTAVLAGAHAALTRALLHTEPDTTRTELVAVERSRARLVDAFDAERRRIERDLHDGAQQRLVSLGMHLGLAAMDLNRATAEGRAETPGVTGGRPEPDPGADALGSATAAVAAAQLEAKAL
ncbi:MAG TPA: sensor domain-containing protein, partial [Micromonosporaceae bacterium]